MEVMYISKAFESNLGARLHYRAIREIFGEDRIFTIDLRPEVKEKRDGYIAYGKYKTILHRFGRWVQGNMMYISNAVIQDICRIIDREDIKIVFIEDSVFGNLVKRIKTRYSHVRVISFYHDIKADLFPQWTRKAKGLKSKFLFGIEGYIGVKEEYRNQKYADINLVFNQRDAELFREIYGRLPEGILPLPAPIPEKPFEEFPETDTMELLFVGKKYYPNIEGIHWFCREVMPKLPENVRLRIVGRGLEYLREEITDPRVEVVGGVESLDPYYRSADMVIAPLFDGGGMKSKTVEALSFGKCFLGTQESLFGFWDAMDDTLRNKLVFQMDSAQEWAACLQTLARSKPRKFYPEIFDLFRREFSYEAIKESLEKYLIS